MSEHKGKLRKVVVIGGGITGLSTCWYLESQSKTRLEIVLVEANQTLGGKMITKKIFDGDQAFIVDAGPESFVTRKPEAWELALELGLKDQIIDPGNETRNMYVLDQGEPKKIPLAPWAFITSDLLSFGGKLRMMIEPLIRPKKDNEDESLADFVTRRLGGEALEKMIGPVLAGIYNTDPNTQSIMVSSPVMREMEKEHGGLVRGAVARMLKRKKNDKNVPRPPQFMTFKEGAQVMVDALEAQLSAQILKGVKAQSIQRDGKTFAVELAKHGRLHADAVVLATPGSQAGKLLAKLDPDSASLVSSINHKNIGTASLVFSSDQVDLPYVISGLMIPPREKRRIDAITLTSNKPMDRGPDGFEMIRVFFGGGDPRLVTLSKEKIIEVIREELKNILGITASPIKSAVFCWLDSFPQANVGHLDLVAKIEAQLPGGVYVAGSTYRGIGIPDCIRQGREAAQKTLKYVNQI